MRFRSFITQVIAVLLLLLSSAATAIPTKVQITRLDVPPGLPAPPLNLGTLATAAVLEAVPGSVSIGTELKLVVKIKNAAGQICGNALATALAVRVSKQMLFDGPTMSGAWAACNELEPGVYTLCAQFYSLDGDPVSDERCAEFRVAEAPVKNAYTAPVNLTPVDGSHELEETFRSGIRFSWKPVSPGHDGPVTYRLRVWKVADGKDAGAAIRDGKPVLTRDLENATEITLSNALPVPCAIGKSCRFAWNVQALDAMGKSIGENEGTSQPSMLIVTTYAIQLDKISVLCTSTPGVYTFSFSLTNINIGTAKLTNFLATSSLPAGATVTTFTPPLNTNIAAGVQITITGTINAPPGLSNICLGAQITDVGNGFWQASKDTCIPVLPCKCEACDPKKVDIKVPTGAVTINANNTATLSQPLTVTTTPLKLVKSVNAELVYYAFAPDDENCMPCNKDSRTYGNFLSGSLGTLAGSGNGTHGLEWNFSPPKNGSGITPFITTISMPPMVKCCDATLRFCIRYVITFADCTVCYKTVCYEKRLDGCSTGAASTNNN